VFDLHPRSDGTDFNLNGIRDEASDEWTNPDFNGGESVEVARRWRVGQRDYLLAIKARYPEIVLTVNSTTWSREYLTTPPTLPEEYVNLAEGGIQEAQSNLSTEGYPWSGVASDGTTHPTGAAGFGKWVRAQNGYTYQMDSMIGRKLVCNDWWVEFNNLRFNNVTNPLETDLIDDPARGWVTPNRIQFYDAYPEDALGWNLVRWSLASTLMDNGYYCLTGMNAATGSGYFGVCCHVDEFGTTNQSTTGLSKGWMGYPIDAPVRTANLQGTLFMREFDNALVVLNPEWDDTEPAVTVQVANLPGGAGAWKRITGENDPTFNNGSVVNSNFTLDPIDAVILMRNT